MNLSVSPLPSMDRYEYHGHTVVEQVRHGNGEIVWRRWLLFDSVEEAQDFFYGLPEAQCREGGA